MATSQEKILAYHMSRLQDKRPEVQLNAIEELVAMGANAKSALKALEECHKNAADDQVKRAAQLGGFAIYKAVKDAGESIEDA